MTQLLRGTGWTLILAGTIVLLYVVYSLFFTGYATEAAQASLRDAWETEIGSVEATPAPSPTPLQELPGDDPTPSGEDPTAAAEPPPVAPGEAVAVLEFRRPDGEPVVHAEPLFVVEGVSRDDLTRGPGHYPSTALPGEPGNVAIAGHRTTYAAPFFHLDQLSGGDEVLVTGRDGVRHVYRVVEQRIVVPSDVSVIGPDPLGTGRPTLTLTTCHPRFSAQQRMIVFAELVE